VDIWIYLLRINKGSMLKIDSINILMM
jgi:hypothetical protein